MLSRFCNQLIDWFRRKMTVANDKESSRVKRKHLILFTLSRFV